jgi:uncharacterized membrane protein (UPF0127 family)
VNHYSLPFTGPRGPRILRVVVAASMFERLRGLLARPALQGEEGMLLPSCRLIHTFGMRYPIDVVYLGKGGQVLKVTAALAPGRMDGHLRACSVLELAAGAAQHCGIVPGVRLPLDWRGRP